MARTVKVNRAILRRVPPSPLASRLPRLFRDAEHRDELRVASVARSLSSYVSQQRLVSLSRLRAGSGGSRALRTRRDKFRRIGTRHRDRYSNGYGNGYRGAIVRHAINARWRSTDEEPTSAPAGYYELSASAAAFTRNARAPLITYRVARYYTLPRNYKGAIARVTGTLNTHRGQVRGPTPPPANYAKHGLFLLTQPSTPARKRGFARN